MLTEYLLEKLIDLPKLKIISPFNESKRGSHISILIEDTCMKQFKESLSGQGILGDLRKFENDTYLMRITPTGLYNSYKDCDRLIDTLE